MRRQLFIKTLLLVGLPLLSGCSMLSPVKVDAKSTYVLNTVPSSVERAARRPITLLVMSPETRPTYNTTQMAYSTRHYEVAYFSQNQWAETPSQMLQPLLVQTLQNTHLFHAVVTPPYVGRYDYVLYTEITQLQQDFTSIPARAQIKVRAQLTRVATSNVIATQEFVVSEPVLQKSPYGGVIAANHATAQILREIASFCVKRINHTA